MADNSELQLKITLDDGSIVQGFLNIEKKAKSTGESVAKGLDGKGKGVGLLKESIEDLSNSFAQSTNSIGGFSSRLITALGPVGLITGAIGGAVFALGKMALAGEQVNAINTQFGKVAESAGLQVDSFKESIIASTQGLIDDEDALQIATKGIIALGAEASKLPQVLDLSRNVSRALGKDFKDTFENLSSFLEVGNARALKQYGIVLDLEKAYSAAAKEVGLTTAQLTEQQKQIIRTNLVLDELPKKFGAAADSVTPLKDAFDRLKVTASNSLESVQSSAAKLITSLFIDKSDLSNVGVTRLKERAQESTEQIKKLQTELDKLNNSETASKPLAYIATLNARIKNLQEEVDRSLIEQSGRSDAELFAALENSKKVSDVKKNDIKLNDEQRAIINENSRKRLEEARKIETEFSAFVTSQDQLRLNNQIAQNNLLINENTTAEQKLRVINENNNIQDQLRDEQKNQQILAIQQKYSALKLSGSQFEKDSLLAIESNFAQQQLLAEQTRVSQLKAIEDQANFDKLQGFAAVGSGFQQITEGASQAAKNFAANSNAAFKQVGAQAFATLSQGVGRAFNNFGSALARGEDAGAAFAEAMGDSLLQIAGQFADMFIQVGIGKLAMSYGSDATGYAMIAAGAALKILAGAIGGKKSAGSSPSVDTGGGLTTAPGNPITDFNPTTQERQRASTTVQLNVQGDIFDSQDTAMRLADIMNANFEKNGVVIRSGAVA